MNIQTYIYTWAWGPTYLGALCECPPCTPSSMGLATEMNLTPVLHHVDGPAPRPCRAAIPEPGPCAGEGLDAGGDSGGGSDTARTCVDC